MIMTRNEMLKELHEGICVVVFEKVDGTERTMKCTLLEERIPTAKRPKDKSAAEFSEEVIRVYDVEKDGWRSFKISSVKSFF
jgi:hypothetical protein